MWTFSACSLLCTYALQWEMRINMGKTCRYFLNYFPSKLMSGDARKPNISSLIPRTLYTKFWRKKCCFTVKIEGFFNYLTFPLIKHLIFTISLYLSNFPWNSASFDAKYASVIWKHFLVKILKHWKNQKNPCIFIVK